MRVRSRRPLGWAAVGLVVGFVIWTRVVVGHTQVPGPVEALAVIAVIFAARLARSDHYEGWAFTASAAAIAATVGSIFIDLYPNVMVSSTERRIQPDREQLRLWPLRAGGHDDRDRALPPARAGLPGLVLLRLPRPREGPRATGG